MKRTLIASILIASVFNGVNAQNSIEPKSIPDPIYKASTIPKCNYTPVLNFIGRVKWGNSTSYGTSASCYSYVQFQGDDEKDCIIKFNYYGSGRKLIDKST